MHEYPVWDVFSKIGTVQITEQGLYLNYEAAIQSNRFGFLRLYHHVGNQTCRLGLFSEENDILTCQGRISLRSLGLDWQSGIFSIQEMPIYPLETPLDGGYLPSNAVEYQKDGRRFVAVSCQNRLPEEILPYFCFLTPETVAGLDCLVLERDADGMPVIQ